MRGVSNGVMRRGPAFFPAKNGVCGYRVQPKRWRCTRRLHVSLLTLLSALTGPLAFASRPLLTFPPRGSADAGRSPGAAAFAPARGIRGQQPVAPRRPRGPSWPPARTSAQARPRRRHRRVGGRQISYSRTVPPQFAPAAVRATVEVEVFVTSDNAAGEALPFPLAVYFAAAGGGGHPECFNVRREMEDGAARDGFFLLSSLFWRGPRGRRRDEIPSTATMGPTTRSGDMLLPTAVESRNAASSGRDSSHSRSASAIADEFLDVCAEWQQQGGRYTDWASCFRTARAAAALARQQAEGASLGSKRPKRRTRRDLALRCSFPPSPTQMHATVADLRRALDVKPWDPVFTVPSCVPLGDATASRWVPRPSVLMNPNPLAQHLRSLNPELQCGVQEFLARPAAASEPLHRGARYFIRAHSAAPFAVLPHGLEPEVREEVQMPFRYPIPVYSGTRPPRMRASPHTASGLDVYLQPASARSHELHQGVLVPPGIMGPTTAPSATTSRRAEGAVDGTRRRSDSWNSSTSTVLFGLRDDSGVADDLADVSTLDESAAACESDAPTNATRRHQDEELAGNEDDGKDCHNRRHGLQLPLEHDRLPAETPALSWSFDSFLAGIYGLCSTCTSAAADGAARVPNHGGHDMIERPFVSTAPPSGEGESSAAVDHTEIQPPITQQYYEENSEFVDGFAIFTDRLKSVTFLLKSLEHDVGFYEGSLPHGFYMENGAESANGVGGGGEVIVHNAGDDEFLDNSTTSTWTWSSSSPMLAPTPSPRKVGFMYHLTASFLPSISRERLDELSSSVAVQRTASNSSHDAGVSPGNNSGVAGAAGVEDEDEEETREQRRARVHRSLLKYLSDVVVDQSLSTDDDVAEVIQTVPDREFWVNDPVLAPLKDSPLSWKQVVFFKQPPPHDTPASIAGEEGDIFAEVMRVTREPVTRTVVRTLEKTMLFNSNDLNEINFKLRRGKREGPRRYDRSGGPTGPAQEARSEDVGSGMSPSTGSEWSSSFGDSSPFSAPAPHDDDRQRFVDLTEWFLKTEEIDYAEGFPRNDEDLEMETKIPVGDAIYFTWFHSEAGKFVRREDTQHAFSIALWD